ncbi:MAG: galactose mutarotase [Sphingobacteriales bacterium 41-5]|nr:MAG: galactose mutarotase [Sphingobacteriales bacterium 41-5]
MNKTFQILAFAALAVSVVSCNNAGEQKSGGEDSTDTSSQQSASKFDATIDGRKTALYTLKNTNGMTLTITNYGGRFVSLMVPDSSGKMTDVVIAMDGVEAFKDATEPYLGATIGRYGNRIAKGKFKLDGQEYTLALNNGVNTLHGGKKGFQYVVWDAIQPNDSTLELSYTSPDMEEGYPGELKTKVVYSLTGDNAVKMEYTATTNKPTVVNLTNHAFFNLNGAGSGDILSHQLQIFADKYIPVDTTLIPTGIKPVAGTPFDFRNPTAIGARIEDDNEQLKAGKGYDHCYVLNGTKGDYGMTHAARAKGDKSGIIMDVLTQEPGVQLYTGNFMQSKNTLVGGFKDDFRTAFCLETQHYPDSPNQPSFPSTVLKPGETYHTISYYKFSK